MELFILNRDQIYDRNFRAEAKNMPRTGLFGRLMDWLDTRVDVTITFRSASPTNDQILAVHNVVGRYFGRKNVTMEEQTIRLKMGRSEFCHPRNREFLKTIINGALLDERPRGPQVA
jgi:hypothetical protein